MFDYTTPFDVHLQWFAEEGQGDVDTGQDVVSPEPVESFYEFTEPIDGGETHKFTSPDELTEFIKGSYLRHSDYTRKTQELADQRKSHELARTQFENDRAAFNTRRDEYEKKIEQYKQYDEFLKSNPHIVAELKKKVGVLPEDALQEKMDKYFQEKYGKDIEELKAQKRQQELAVQKENAEKALMAKYKDYDSKAVQEAYVALQNGDLSTLLELLHFGIIGKKSIPELEQQILEDQAKKQGAGLITSTGKGATNPPPANPAKSIEEAKQRARKDL